MSRASRISCSWRSSRRSRTRGSASKFTPQSKETPMSEQRDNVFGSAAKDADTQETREWLEALDAVIGSEGKERAHCLSEQLREDARQHGIDMPFSATPAYVN